MFHLECHDIKKGLVDAAKEYADTITQHLVDIHLKECERLVIDEYHVHTYTCIHVHVCDITCTCTVHVHV